MAENITLPENTQELDGIIRQGIVAFFESDGAHVADPQNAFAEEVRKIKESLLQLPKPLTTDSLKLAISEVMMDSLAPKSASVQSKLHYAIEGMIRNARIENYIFHNADKESFTGKSGPEVETITNQVERHLGRDMDFAQESSKELTKRQKFLTEEKLRLSQQKKEIDRNLQILTSLNEKDKDVQEKLKSLVNDPQIQMLSQQERSSMTSKNKAGEEIVKRNKGGHQEELNIGEDVVAKLNTIFNQGHSDKFSIPINIVSGNRPTNKLKYILLWSRFRFAFERLVGNESTALYQHRKTAYNTYVVANKSLSDLLSTKIGICDRLLMVCRKKLEFSEQFITNVSKEHKHWETNKNIDKKNIDMINYLMQNYENQYKEMNKTIQPEIMEENTQIDEKLSTVYEKLEALFSEDSFYATGEPREFDPEFLHNLRNRQNEQKQKAKSIPQNLWMSSDEQGNLELAPATSGVEATWREGMAIYERIDKPDRQQIEKDVNAIFHPRNAPKKQNPDEINAGGGWSKSMKLAIANSTQAHWSLLWNLVKKDVTNEDPSQARDKYLGKDMGEAEKTMPVSDGEEQNLRDAFRQWVGINPLSVRVAVINNTATPDWIIMYASEHEDDIQLYARKKLEDRNWKLKLGKDRNIEKDPDDNSWIWIKSAPKIASMFLSYREALVTNPAIPANPLEMSEEQKNINQPNPAVPPAVPPVNNAPVGAPDKSSPANPKESRPEISKQKAFEDGLIPQTIKPVPIADAKKQAQLSWRG